jgi:hypothetical protein
VYGVGTAACALPGFDCEDYEKCKVWSDCGEKIVNDGLMEQQDSL